MFLVHLSSQSKEGKEHPHLTGLCPEDPIPEWGWVSHSSWVSRRGSFLSRWTASSTCLLGTPRSETPKHEPRGQWSEPMREQQGRAGVAIHCQCLTFGLVPWCGDGRGTLMGAYPFSGSSSRVSSCPLCSWGGREEVSVVSTYGVEWAEQKSLPRTCSSGARVLGTLPLASRGGTLVPSSLSSKPWHALCSFRPAGLLPAACLLTAVWPWPQLLHLESGDNKSSSSIPSGEKEM